MGFWYAVELLNNHSFIHSFTQSFPHSTGCNCLHIKYINLKMAQISALRHSCSFIDLWKYIYVMNIVSNEHLLECQYRTSHFRQKKTSKISNWLEGGECVDECKYWEGGESGQKNKPEGRGGGEGWLWEICDIFLILARVNRCDMCKRCTEKKALCITCIDRYLKLIE